MRTLLLILTLVLVGLTTPTAQTRLIPPASAPGPFALGSIEQGAPGDYVIVPLRDTLEQAPSVVKAYSDHLFYSPTLPGPYLLVVSVLNPYGAGTILDCHQWEWLPPGLQLTPTYLDADARQDVIGRDPQTGEIYRWHRRGRQTLGCW